MTALRKIRCGYSPWRRLVLAADHISHSPEWIQFQHYRRKHRRVLLGIVFLIVLVASVVSFPPTIKNQPTYLNLQGVHTTIITAGPGLLDPSPSGQEFPIPATGK